jgi:membrane-associated phospholipid phosphatase
VPYHHGVGAEPGPPPDPRVERVLQREVARVDSPEAAEAVLDQVERLAAGETEQSAADAAAAAQAPEQPAHPGGPPGSSTTPSAGAVVEAAASQPAPPAEQVASTLVAAAAESVAPTEQAGPVLEAAQTTLGPGAPAQPPATQRGRSLLKAAVLRRMAPLQALDARLYLAVNEASHPAWLDRLGWAIALVFTGGWVWVGGVAVARARGVPRSGEALKALLPSLVAATWAVDYPIKAYFRRRRPFIDIVRALVVGKKPGSWSFPSGHTASSFASAWVLSTVWPRRAPSFFALAAVVGLSRVYVGAHYPGDVLSGALAGLSLAELTRRLTHRLFRFGARG